MDRKKNDKKIDEKIDLTRRDFVKSSALGVATIGAAGAVHGCAGVDPIPTSVTPMQAVTSDIRSVVSVVHSPKAMSDDRSVDGKTVATMFEQALFAITGKTTQQEAWSVVLPELQPTDAIGIKVNCLNADLPTHPELVYAIADQLQQLGIKDNNIIVWDRRGMGLSANGHLEDCGYQVNEGATGVRCHATEIDGFGYDETSRVKVPSLKLDLAVSKIVSTGCKYIINVAQLRHHGRSGITQALKNYYGAIPIMGPLTPSITEKMHADNCNPGIPELYANTIFREKTKLHVSDALMTCFEGGPFGKPQVMPNKILLSTDPVALDYVGYTLIEKERQKRGLETLSRRCKFIETAAQMGLGTNHPEQMEIRQVTV